jgi:hypothetical protein
MPDSSNHGRDSERTVVYGGETVRGLRERRLKDGSLAFDWRPRINGKQERKTLVAKTRGDAVREFREKQADLRQPRAPSARR